MDEAKMMLQGAVSTLVTSPSTSSEYCTVCIYMYVHVHDIVYEQWVNERVSLCCVAMWVWLCGWVLILSLQCTGSAGRSQAMLNRHEITWGFQETWTAIHAQQVMTFYVCEYRVMSERLREERGSYQYIPIYVQVNLSTCYCTGQGKTGERV